LRESPTKLVIACRVVEPEIEALRKDVRDVEVRYLEQSLHRTPQNMASRIQAELDTIPRDVRTVVLGYGLCSNGIVGVVAPAQGLIVPKAHDCIALLMGSLEAYKRAFRERPGTYYLTPGWVAEGKDPLGILKEYTENFGEETALWVMNEELKHYTHIALIDTGIGDLDRLRERGRENARIFGKEYTEIKGDLAYLRKLLQGPYTEEEFLFFSPGQKVAQESFLEEVLTCRSR